MQRGDTQRGRGNRQKKAVHQQPLYLDGLPVQRSRVDGDTLHWHFGDDSSVVLAASLSQQDLVLFGEDKGRGEYELHMVNGEQVNDLAKNIQTAIKEYQREPEIGHHNYEWENGLTGTDKQMYELLLRWDSEVPDGYVEVGARTTSMFDKYPFGISGACDWATLSVETLQGLGRTLETAAIVQRRNGPHVPWTQVLESIWSSPSPVAPAATTRPETLQQQLLGQRTGTEQS